MSGMTLYLQDYTHHVEVESLWQIGLPTTTGDAAILPGHAPMLFSLRVGILKTIPGNTLYCVAGGVAEVAQKTCHINTPYFQKITDLKPAQLTRQLEAAQQLLKTTEDQATHKALQDKILLYSQILKLFTSPKAR